MFSCKRSGGARVISRYGGLCEFMTFAKQLKPGSGGARVISRYGGLCECMTFAKQLKPGSGGARVICRYGRLCECMTFTKQLKPGNETLWNSINAECLKFQEYHKLTA